MVNNLITMISINIIQIKDAIAKNGIHVHADIIKFLDLIESKNFNSTKCWLAERVNIQKGKGTCFNFYGSEQRFGHHIHRHRTRGGLVGPKAPGPFMVSIIFCCFF